MVSILLLPNCYAQQNDSICFSYQDAKRILILANKGKQVDSLIYFYDARIEMINEIVDHKDEQLIVARDLISEQSILIGDLQAKLSEAERKKKNIKVVAASLFGIALTELVIIIL